MIGKLHSVEKAKFLQPVDTVTSPLLNAQDFCNLINQKIFLLTLSVSYISVPSSFQKKLAGC